MWLKIILFILICIGALLAFGPREPVDLTVWFSDEEIGADIDAYLAQSEARVKNLDPAHAKAVVWAGERGNRTRYSVVYLHGFSATKEEIRPVPDKVAAALGANLYFARLAGHGRDGAAMAEARVNDWVHDVAEALAIGRRLGERVIVLSTSTGGTVFTLLALDQQHVRGVDGVVFMSPNFGVQAAGSRVLTLPFARYFLRYLVGEERSWTPQSEAQDRHWNTSYPTTALLPMAAAVEVAAAVPVEQVQIPAFFIYSPDDTVISPDAVLDVADRWGGPVSRWSVAGSEVGDASAHVLAGDIVSPQTTEMVAQRLIEWVRGL